MKPSMEVVLCSNREVMKQGLVHNLNMVVEMKHEQPPLHATVGVLVDNMGSTYALRLGINTIGRSAASSTATIQIATNDRTMSRSHAVIEVSNAGGKTIHILRNGANKNPSYMNGVLIGQQDQLVLNNGDRIKMGSTELTFKK